MHTWILVKPAIHVDIEEILPINYTSWNRFHGNKQRTSVTLFRFAFQLPHGIIKMIDIYRPANFKFHEA